MNALQRIKLYSGFAQIAVGKSIDTTEKIHFTLSDYIFSRMSLTKLSQETHSDQCNEPPFHAVDTATASNSDSINAKKAYYDKHVADTYALIRQLNQHIGLAVTDFISDIDNGKQMLSMLETNH